MANDNHRYLQVKVIMKELSKHGNQGRAAAKAGVCRQTAARYIEAGKLPSELKKTPDWQTKPTPFAEVWPEIEARLKGEPGVWVRFLFEEWLGAIRGDLLRDRGGRYTGILQSGGQSREKTTVMKSFSPSSPGRARRDKPPSPLPRVWR
jgi:hypothetical protein